MKGGLCKELTCIDYRVPQMLHSLNCLSYCPPLENKIRRHEIIPSGHTWELQLRGKSSLLSSLLAFTLLHLTAQLF